MSNLYSDDELCYLQTVDCLHLLHRFFSFPFNVVLSLTYNRCTNTCSKTRQRFIIMKVLYG